jgi:hypothetical protein
LCILIPELEWAFYKSDNASVKESDPVLSKKAWNFKPKSNIQYKFVYVNDFRNERAKYLLKMIEQIWRSVSNYGKWF